MNKGNLHFIKLDNRHPDSKSIPKTRKHLLEITDGLEHTGLEALGEILRSLPQAKGDAKYDALNEFSPEIRVYFQQVSCVRLLAFNHSNPDMVFDLVIFADQKHRTSDFSFTEESEVGYAAFAVMVKK